MSPAPSVPPSATVAPARLEPQLHVVTWHVAMVVLMHQWQTVQHRSSVLVIMTQFVAVDRAQEVAAVHL